MSSFWARDKIDLESDLQYLSLMLDEFEPRILFSAAPIGTEMVQTDPVGNDFETLLELSGGNVSRSEMDPYGNSGYSYPSMTLQSDESPTELVNENVDLSDFSSTDLETATDMEVVDASLQGTTMTRDGSVELVFVDESSPDYFAIVEDIMSSGAQDRNIRLVQLDSELDGVTQISETLAGYESVTSIHLISHGTEGKVKLGNAWLGMARLEQYAGEISKWENSLAGGADLLLYGCDLAASEDGRALASSLSALCNCDVAASDDLTGHALLGGDWDLEFRHGEIETSTVFSFEFQVTWRNVLGTTVVVDTTDDYGTTDARYGNTSSIATLLSDKGTDNLITFREAVDAANNSANGASPDEIHFNISDNDARHFYYRDDGIVNSLSLAVTTTLDDGSISDFDPDYPYSPHSWFSIDLNSTLPRINVTDEVIIDGFTQAGAFANTLTTGTNAVLRIELTSDGGGGHRGITVLDGGDGSVFQGLNINSFGSAGILTESGADGVVIQGNFLGTDISGTRDLGNSDGGVHLRSGGNVVGGSDVADRNLISGNDGRGIVTFTFGPIEGSNVFENNYIGVDATGLNALDNQSAGIQVYNQDGIQIRDNVIAGNSGYGIWLRAGSTVDNSIIQGNSIGVGADGISAIGNTSHGIHIEAGGDQSTIGGVLAGQANIIASNLGAGIHITGGSDRHTIRGNSFYGNSGLGIDLNGDSVSANDLFDADGGSNNRQNFPVLTEVLTNESTLISITGNIHSTPSTILDIDFYFSLTLDSSLHGEGGVYLGSASVTTNGSGDASFTDVQFSANVPAGAFVTATATSASGGSIGNTSEFSLNLAAVSNTEPLITSDGGGATALVNVAENTTAVTTVSATDLNAPPQNLTFAILGGADATRFNLDSSSGVLTFVVAPDFETPIDGGLNNVYDVDVQVTDGFGGSDTQSISVMVQDVDEDPPFVVNNNGTAVTEGTAAGIDDTELRFDDSDQPAASVTYTVTGGLANGQLELTTAPLTPVLSFSQDDIDAGRLIYRHDGSPTNSDSFTFDVNDGQGNSVIGSLFSIIVNQVNLFSPAFTSAANPNVAENQFVIHTLSATDADVSMQGISFSIAGTGADDTKFFINGANELAFLSAPDFESPQDSGLNNVYDVDLAADDGAGGVTVQSIQVTVNDVNEQPITQDDSWTLVSGQSLTMAVADLLSNDNDPEHGLLSFSILSSPASGTLIVNPDNTLTFQPAPGFVGQDFFIYVVDDGVTGPVTAKVTFNVAPVPFQIPPAGSGDPELSEEESENAETINGVPNITPEILQFRQVAASPIQSSSVSHHFEPVAKVSIDMAETASEVIESNQSTSFNADRLLPHRPNDLPRASLFGFRPEAIIPPDIVSTEFVSVGYEQLLDELQDEVQLDQYHYEKLVASTMAVTGSISVGYVVWMIRGGVLISSLLSSLPAWKMIDPLPILSDESLDEGENDDSLESLVEKSNLKKESLAKSTAN